MLQPGQILHDRYQLKQKLGQVTGRQTWLAEDITAQPTELIVVKLLAFGDQVQWDDLKLFEREAQVLRQLNHSQIPKYRDYFSIDDRLLWFGLVEDYIPGASLKELLTQGKHFTEQQVRQMAKNLLHLLSYLHELSPPVLHRDIKPSNLIWGEDNYVYLVDFGAVQDKAAAEGQTFTVVGTYGYAPIEQYGGRAVPASDLYALGATLIHLLTGVSPAELPQKDLQIQFSDRVSLDPDFVYWVSKLVEPDVKKRFQTAREALEALRSLEKQSAVPTPQTRSKTPHERSLSRNTERSLTPPLGSRLQAQETADELLITVPGESLWTLLTLIPIGFVLVLMGELYLVDLTIVMGGWPLAIAAAVVALIAWTTYQALLPTFVVFRKDKFSVYKLPFGLMSSSVDGSTAEIQNVFHTLKSFSSGKSHSEKRVVMIQTHNKEDYFGVGLSWDECSWLVAVTKDWLNLR
jgi:serine/threonine protein kinase